LEQLDSFVDTLHRIGNTYKAVVLVGLVQPRPEQRVVSQLSNREGSKSNLYEPLIAELARRKAKNNS
jgi:hypothetical protein